MSRLLRFDAASFRWEGVAVREYKARAGDECAWEGVTRQTLAGRAGEPLAFQLRYFEIAPGGFSSHERHGHAHVIIGLRGRGVAQVGEQVHEVHPFDVLFIAPEVPHQFRNAAADEPFGFLCPVDAARDRPRPA